MMGNFSDRIMWLRERKSVYPRGELFSNCSILSRALTRVLIYNIKIPNNRILNIRYIERNRKLKLKEENLKSKTRGAATLKKKKEKKRKKPTTHGQKNVGKVALDGNLYGVHCLPHPCDTLDRTYF